METIVIDRRFRGPDQSGNGGYTCGVIAQLLDGDAEVTLRVPPPLDTPLRVERDNGELRIFDGGTLVADARALPLDLDPPPPVAFDEAQARCAAQPPDPRHPFPGCFVCGPGREPADALRLNPTPLRDGRVVATWRPTEELAGRRELVWAPLDCPGAFAVDPGLDRGVSLLGRLHAHVEDVPRVDEPCVVVAWRLDEGEQRKRFAGTALFGEGGRLLGLGRATWFLLEVGGP